MKVSINVDCTPEEARRFMGLPDLTGLHAAYIDRMKSAMTEGVPAEAFADMMKSWGPAGDAGMAMWKQMMESMSGKT